MLVKLFNSSIRYLELLNVRKHPISSCARCYAVNAVEHETDANGEITCCGISPAAHSLDWAIADKPICPRRNALHGCVTQARCRDQVEASVFRTKSATREAQIEKAISMEGHEGAARHAP